MEGNQYGFRTTPRTCDDATALGHFEKCDADGDLAFDINTDQTEKSFGPGNDINPKHQVDVTVDFVIDENDILTGYNIKVEQGDQIVTMKKEGEYLAKLTPYLKAGMVFQVR